MATTGVLPKAESDRLGDLFWSSTVVEVVLQETPGPRARVTIAPGFRSGHG